MCTFLLHNKPLVMNYSPEWRRLVWWSRYEPFALSVTTGAHTHQEAWTEVRTVQVKELGLEAGSSSVKKAHQALPQSSRRPLVALTKVKAVEIYCLWAPLSSVLLNLLASCERLFTFNIIVGDSCAQRQINFDFFSYCKAAAYHVMKIPTIRSEHCFSVSRTISAILLKKWQRLTEFKWKFSFAVDPPELPQGPLVVPEPHFQNHCPIRLTVSRCVA